MKQNTLIIAILLLTVVGAIFLTSCDDRALDPVSYKISSIYADPEIIYTDNNVTYSEIYVTVKDDDNFAVVGESVTFRTNVGNILNNIPTDSSGVAVSTFWDNGESGNALIEAFIGNTKATVNVNVLPLENLQVDSLQINVTSDEITVNNITNVRVVAKYQGENIQNGIPIVLETNLGYFVDSEENDIGDSVQLLSSNGLVNINLNVGTETGTLNLTAKIGTMVREKEIIVNPGAPSTIYMPSPQGPVYANSGEIIEISATIKDVYNNHVAMGTLVNFSTDLGNIQASSATNEEGVAIANYYPGIESGIATITAEADSASAQTSLQIYSDDVYSIEFNFQQQVDIQIQGTGGQESFEMQVNLYDRNGNLYDQQKPVWFRFVNAPNGTNINNEVISPDFITPVEVLSSNGNAYCSINSGNTSGTVSIEAYTYADADTLQLTKIRAEKSNIVVHSGPPYDVSISNPGLDSATNVGGGQWQVEIGAMVIDQWGNSVDYGTAVWFSLDIEPGQDWAYIDTEAAYVGNQNAEGDSLSGTAFTKLTFDGSHTNETLMITVNVADLEETIPFFIHGQFLGLDLVVLPQHLDWHPPYTEDDGQGNKTATVRIEVHDQQNNYIANQQIYVYSDYGFPEQGDDVEDHLFTTDENGSVDVLWEFNEEDIPDPLDAPVSISGTITAQILGPGTSESVTIILRKYP